MANAPLENNNVDMSFLEEDNDNSIQMKDIFFIILRNLYWFILCGFLGAGISYWKVNKEERTYASSASIMIKTGATSGSESIRSSSVMNQMLGNEGLVSTINNEIIILKSASLMDSVVRDLGLNVTYSYKTRVAKRNKVLYQDSPISVSFENLDESAYYSFLLTPKDSVHFAISNLGKNAHEKVVAFGEEVMTPVGTMIVSEKWNYKNMIDVPIVVEVVPVSSMSASLRARLRVSRDDEKNSILRLSIIDQSASRAADILNTLISVYNNDVIADQERMLDYSYKFINGRIDQLYGDLDSLQEQVVGFKVANVLVDTKSLGEAELAARSASSVEVKNLQARISRVSYLLDAANDVADDDILPVMSDVGTEAATLITKYNANSQKLQKYRESGVTENPAAKKLAAEQPALLANIVAILESDLSSLQTQADMAREEGTVATSRIQAVPEKQVRIGSVEDMLRIRQQLYLTLLTKREEMLLNRPKFEGTAKVIDAAQINNSPIAPNPKKSVTSGLLIGLLIPAVIILLNRLFDTAIYDRADVEKATKTPFLGEIPYKENVSEHAIVVKENGRDPVSEAFRLVRSNVEYMRNRKRESNVLLFTSFMVSSGKTFVSSNLATSFALGNKKVVLVDLDIRKGTMNKVFGLKAKFGVSNYLSGKIDDVEEIIHHDFAAKNMDLIFVGPVPPNPAELLMSDRLEQMISYLRQHYDYVFLDNVPLGIVADADIVKRVADITLFVIRAGKTDKRLLNEIDKLYKNDKFPNLAIVLNSVKFKKQRGYGYGYGYGYGNGYGYGYGYGYGCGNEEEQGKKRHHHHQHKSDESSEDNKD